MPVEQEKKGEGRAALVSIRNLKEEIKLVSWTSKEELRKGAKLVISSIFLCGFAIYVVDLLMRGCLGGLRILFHWIFG